MIDPHYRRGEYVIFDEKLWRVDAAHLSNAKCSLCPDVHDDYALSRLNAVDLFDATARVRTRPRYARTRGCQVNPPRLSERPERRANLIGAS